MLEYLGSWFRLPEVETKTLEPGDVLSFGLTNQFFSREKRIEAYQARGYNGLSNIQDLSEKLGRGDYMPVLKSLWSEQNSEKKIIWLRDNSAYHVPLMLERAVAEVEQTPTIETIVNVSLPLIEAALFRIQQDFSCCHEKDTLSFFIKDTYQKVVIGKFFDQLKQVPSQKRFSKIKQKVIEVAQETLTKLENDKLVPPNWIANQPKDSSAHKMHPEEEWAERRKRVAQEMIQKMEEKNDFE